MEEIQEMAIDWRANRAAVYKKGCIRLYFLKEIITFNVCDKMLEIVNQSVVASALFSSVVCHVSQWHQQVGQTDQERLQSGLRKLRCLRDHLQGPSYQKLSRECFPPVWQKAFSTLYLNSMANNEYIVNTPCLSLSLHIFHSMFHAFAWISCCTLIDLYFANSCKIFLLIC